MKASYLEQNIYAKFLIFIEKYQEYMYNNS